MLRRFAGVGEEARDNLSLRLRDAADGGSDGPSDRVMLPRSGRALIWSMTVLSICMMRGMENVFPTLGGLAGTACIVRLLGTAVAWSGSMHQRAPGAQPNSGRLRDSQIGSGAIGTNLNRQFPSYVWSALWPPSELETLLRLSLITCPVALYGNVRFRENQATGSNT